METPLRFEKPHAGLQNSYRDFIREFEDAEEPLIPFPLMFPNHNFEAFLSQLEACARGEGIPPGFVPHSTYWLVHNESVVAVSNLRHSLTDALRHDGGNIGYGVRPSARGNGFAKEILRQTLVPARELGLSAVLVICEKNNTASARTILANGGVLDSEEFLPKHSETIQRYWISLSSIS